MVRFRLIYTVLLFSLSDINPQVNFYWWRGQRIIPKGHRKGRQEPIRFQIDDRPHSQIRISQQLPQVVIISTPWSLCLKKTEQQVKISHDSGFSYTTNLPDWRKSLHTAKGHKLFKQTDTEICSKLTDDFLLFWFLLVYPTGGLLYSWSSRDHVCSQPDASVQTTVRQQDLHR